MENTLKPSLEHAKSLFEQRNYEACKKELQSLLNSDYEVATCYYYLGLISLNSKDYDEAAIIFSSILKNDPTNFNCLYFLGVIAETEKNVDLALRYYSKTLNEKPGHVNATRAMERLNVAHRDDISHTHQSDDNSTSKNKPSPITETHKEPLQLFDELVEAKDRDSQIAVDMIRSTQMIKKRPRISAFIGTFFLRVIILPPILTFIYFRLGLPFKSPAIYMGGPENTIIGFYIITILLCLIYTIIKIKSTIVTIERGLIQIKKGVLTRRKTLILNHKTDHFVTYQSFFNLLTGDCTLIFDAEGKGRYKITGLGKIKDIDDLSIKLQNLRYQLRNTPLIKSGIFG